MQLEAKVPGGPLAEKWPRFKKEQRLISPANKAKYTVIVVGTGLAGASAAASLAELGYKVLSFCFADPFSVKLRFRTVRRLATDRFIDFLILLALGMDANLNLPLYLQDEHQRIEEFLENPAWRTEWQVARQRGHAFIPFLATQYARAMKGLDYLETPLAKMYPVRSYDRNLPLYYLAFFSRHAQGYKLWAEVLKYADAQYELGLEFG